MVGTGSPVAAPLGAAQVNSTAVSVKRASTDAMGAGTGKTRTAITFESAEARFCEARVRTTDVTAPPGCSLVSSATMGSMKITQPSAREVSTRASRDVYPTAEDFSA